MELAITHEEEVLVKEQLLYMQAQIDRSRQLLQVHAVPMQSIVTSPCGVQVEQWLETGEWRSFRKTVQHVLTMGGCDAST